MSCLNILLSMLVGLLPEGLFFSLFIIGAKGIKRGSHRVQFCILSTILFMIVGIILSFNIWYYAVIVCMLYILMKLFYRETEFIDLFILTIPFLLLALIGFACYGIGKPLGIPVVALLIINRILLIICIAALYPKLNKWYNEYKRVWNRRIGNKIKSITIRNISIVACNAVILVAQAMLVILGK